MLLLSMLLDRLVNGYWVFCYDWWMFWLLFVFLCIVFNIGNVIWMCVVIGCELYLVELFGFDLFEFKL